MSKQQLSTLTLAQALDGLSEKAFSVGELTRAVRDQIEKHNKSLNVYLAIDDKDPDEQLRETTLKGVPIAVKDNFLTKDLVTTASSNVLRDYKPAYESTVTRRVLDAGGYIIGKTNMDAWAHGSSTETSDFGPTRNPRNDKHLPGGSSGGSAAAVAADMCIAAIGSETAGSIRQPAAWCGIVGIKPTYGRVSRCGVVAMGSSLDSPGPMGKTVEDCALLLECIAGNDPYDATTSDKPAGAYRKAVQNGVNGMRIGIVYQDHPDLTGSAAVESVKKAGEVFATLGADVSEIPLSQKLKKDAILTPDHAIGIYTIVQRSEVSSNLARYTGVRYGHGRDAFGDEAKRRIMLGTFTLSSGYADKYYHQAQKVRTLYIQNYQQLFETFDVLISPTSPGYALKLGATEGNPMFGELQDVLVEPSSLAGLPGVSVPCYKDDASGLYLGLNITGNQWEEEKIIAAAAAYEKATQWNVWIS